MITGTWGRDVNLALPAETEQPGLWLRGVPELYSDPEAGASFGWRPAAVVGVVARAEKLAKVAGWRPAALQLYRVPFLEGLLEPPPSGEIVSPALELAGILVAPGRERLGPDAAPAFGHWLACPGCPGCQALEARILDFGQRWGPLGLIADGQREAELAGQRAAGSGFLVAEPLFAFLRAAVAFSEWWQDLIRWQRPDPPLAPFERDTSGNRQRLEVQLLVGPGGQAQVMANPDWPARNRQTARGLAGPGLNRPSYRGLNHYLDGVRLVLVGSEQGGGFSLTYRFPSLLAAIHLEAALWLTRRGSVLSACARPDCGRAFLRFPSRERHHPKRYCSQRCQAVAAHQRLRARAKSPA